MKRFVQAITFALASACLMSSAMAAPQQQADDKHGLQHASEHPQTSHQPKSQAAHQKKTPKPSKDWKVGAKVPAGYQKKAYNVDYRAHKLPAPRKGQKWIKVNGDFILVKTANHQIVRFNSH
jgi:Ni/Co efflux regulator RcnB